MSLSVCEWCKLSLLGVVEQYWVSAGLSMPCGCHSDAGKQRTTEVLRGSYRQGSSFAILCRATKFRFRYASALRDLKLLRARKSKSCESYRALHRCCNLCYAFWYPTKKYLFIADLKESKLGVESQGWSGSEFQAIKLPTENAHQPNLL